MLNSVEYAAYVNMKGRIHYTWLGHGDCPPPFAPVHIIISDYKI